MHLHDSIISANWIWKRANDVGRQVEDKVCRNGGEQRGMLTQVCCQLVAKSRMNGVASSHEMIHSWLYTKFK